MSSYRSAIAAALAALIVAAAAPAYAALTHNALTHNALTHNALAASGSPLEELNGVSIIAVTLPPAAGR
jgi:hypothetical protein